MRSLRLVRRWNKCTLSARNANRQVETPHDLSCFTPSPVRSSPSASSPVLPEFPLLDLFHVLIASLKPTARLIFSEAHNYGVPYTFSELVTSLEKCVACLDWKLLERNVRSHGSQNVNDVIEAGCQRTERFESSLSQYPMLHSFLPISVNCFIECHGRRMTCSMIRRSTLFSFLLFQRIFEMGRFPDYVTRLGHIHTLEEMKDYPKDIRVRYITTFRDVHGGAERFEISITASVRGKVLDLPGLAMEDQKRMHTPVRRSKSCESVRSLDSFLSDPVVDWKELLHGYNG